MHAPSADLTLLGMAFGTRPAAAPRRPDRRPGSSASAPARGWPPCSSGCSACASTRGSATPTGAGARCRAAQLEYAAGDVLHLLELADELDRRARELGRDGVGGRGARAPLRPGRAHRAGPRAGLAAGEGARPPERPATGRCWHRVAAWREREARRRDRPRPGWSPTARSSRSPAGGPPTRQALEGERGLPDRIRGADADGLLAARSAAGEAAPPMSTPSRPAPRGAAPPGGARAPSGRCWSSARAAAVDLAPSLLATRDEIVVVPAGGDRAGTSTASRSPPAGGASWRATP